MLKTIKNKENLLAITISGLLAMIFGLNSPLHPWLGGETSTDSSVFKTVTLMMEHGYMPYRDSFDHKGPFIYIINWFGNRISQYRGIWVIEVLAITITIFLMYKIARISCGIIASSITVLTAISLLFIYYEGGNITEEYAMPCIAVGIYIFIDFLLNEVISKVRLILSGICCGIVLMLRPNMIVVWFVFCLLTTALFIYKKEYKKLAELVSLFLIGIVIIILPVAIWLYANDDLSYFIQDYFIFNKRYTSIEGGIALFSSKWNAFFVFFNSTVYIIAFFSMIFHLRDKKLFNITYLIYLVLTIVYMVMSGMRYGHYGMILIPAVVYPISLAFADVRKIKDVETSKTIYLFAFLYLLSVIIMPNWIDLISGMANTYENRDENHCSDVTTDIVNIIESNTEVDEKISVYGNWDVIYVLSNRTHATRYSYQFPVGQVMPEIMDEYIEGLQKESPKIIVVQSGYYDENIKGFLNRNGYELGYSSNWDNPDESSMVFMKN